MTRKEAREFMMQKFYQMDICNNFNIDWMGECFQDISLKTQKDYCETLFSLVCNKRTEIDSLISSHSRNWTIERIPKTDLAVLRLAICEILYIPDIPDAVSVNEAVELAKRYGTEDSPSYVNAILGNIIKEKDRQ
jgi:transcription antitermination factor NusB